MPACAIHLELAERVMRAWSGEPAAPPLALENPAVGNALRLGSLAPDLGYYPRGDRLFSDLAHYIRPAELARELLRQARTDHARAFAWGWATHVLADQRIHPLVNQAVACRHSGSRMPPVPFVADPPAHVREEVGLDRALPLRDGWEEIERLAPLVDESPLLALDAASRVCYGIPLALRRFRRSLRLAIRVVPAWLSPAGGPRRLLARGVRAAGRRGVIAAFLDPAEPPPWLLDAVATEMETLAATFLELARGSLRELPDGNLDTGELEPWPPVYPLAAAALDELNQRHDANPVEQARWAGRGAGHAG